ncbi:MAG TPA: GatB/YqeY domain-containing protein [Candidatus Dormibacteraeota bacterium]|nr:GatB/YqeY domain-containing protein [Candidatus Dormibacteraeota bacterium]
MDPTTRRLRAALTLAIRERNADAAAALKSALAAIANAEAVPAPHSSVPRVGLGAGEAARRHLSEDDVLQIIRNEIAERRSAGTEYERLGRTDAAGRLRAEADALEHVL